MDAPSREQLKALFVSIGDEQNKLMAQRGMSRELNASFAVKLEPLKTPIYVMWQYLDYGDFPDSKEQRIRLSSFKTSSASSYRNLYRKPQALHGW